MMTSHLIDGDDCRGNRLELETRNAVCDMLYLKYPFDNSSKSVKEAVGNTRKTAG